MPLSDEVLPGLLASKVVAARDHLHKVVDGIGLVVAEVGFRNCALDFSNYQLLITVDSEPLFADLERIQGTMSLLLLCVSGLVVLHRSRFEGVVGSEEEVVMNNLLALVKDDALRLTRLFLLVASSVRTFECLAKCCAIWDQSTQAYARFSLAEAKAMCRLVQSLAGMIKFHLEAVENIYKTGQLLPQPQQS